nr:MAG TPA: hypothetical protein [Caudoviricetes sp.]
MISSRTASATISAIPYTTFPRISGVFFSTR